MLQWLNGKKTYLGLIAAGVIGLLVSTDLVQWEKVQWLAVLIGTWTGVAITHKAEKAIDAAANTKVVMAVGPQKLGLN